MPIKLIEPRKGKSPNWTMRGTHLRVYVDESCRTHKRSVARKIRDEREAAIERGEWPARPVVARADLDTFIGAAVNYMETGHSRRYVAPLIARFGETPVADIDQAVIDQAAIEMHPRVTPCSRNRYVYAPVSAILRHAGRQLALRRPKGAKGRMVTELPNSGRRLCDHPGECGILRSGICRAAPLPALHGCQDRRGIGFDMERGRGWTSGGHGCGHPRTATRASWYCGRICAPCSARARRTPAACSAPRQGGWLKWKLLTARMLACGLPAPVRPARGNRRIIPPHRLSWVNHHSFCHTWATWMRRYGGLDEIGLVATKRWKDPRSGEALRPRRRA